VKRLTSPGFDKVLETSWQAEQLLASQ
jgi:hypothetical protein